MVVVVITAMIMAVAVYGSVLMPMGGATAMLLVAIVSMSGAVGCRGELTAMAVSGLILMANLLEIGVSARRRGRFGYCWIP
nr:hypothetical protein [Burkholderia contaminans]